MKKYTTRSQEVLAVHFTDVNKEDAYSQISELPGLTVTKFFEGGHDGIGLIIEDDENTLTIEENDCFIAVMNDGKVDTFFFLQKKDFDLIFIEVE